MTYARERMHYFSRKAIDDISSFPDSPYKSAMTNMVHFNTQRSW